MKKYVTATIAIAFLALGLAIAIPGPTLSTIAFNLNVNVSSLSHIIPSKAVGYLFGSTLGGILFDKFNSYVFLTLSMMVCSIGLAFIPFAQTTTVLAVIMSA